MISKGAILFFYLQSCFYFALNENLKVTLQKAFADCILRETVCTGFPDECVHSMNCDVIFIARNINNFVEFTLIGKAERSTWLAMGLSYDDMMNGFKGDYVTECIIDKDGRVIFGESWNPPDDHGRNLETSDRSWIEDFSAVYQDGLLQCKWLNKGKSKSGFQKNPFEQNWYLMAAKGKVINASE